MFWIYIYYNGPNKSRVVPRFDKWNFTDTEELAISKTGVISNEGDFLRIIDRNFTLYYQLLIP